MFIVIVGTKTRGFAHLTEALGEVAVVQSLAKVQPRPQLMVLDTRRASFVAFDDRQVEVLLRWVQGILQA